MENVLINISSVKLLDWLVLRHICPADWRDRVTHVREKIAHALTDMPEHPNVVDLLSGTSINYFTCLQIVELLKQTEKDTKNIFGFYGSNRMKEWFSVISLYEKDCLYLADAADSYVKNVRYEIPCLRKRIAYLQQLQEDSVRTEDSYEKNVTQLRSKYLKECQRLHIEGDSTRSELEKAVHGLPDMVNTIAHDARALWPSIEFYSRFVNEICTRSEKHVEVLPLLRKLLERDIFTVYEWKYGKLATKMQPFQFSIDNLVSKEQLPDTDCIDFGDFDLKSEDTDVNVNNCDNSAEKTCADEDNQNVAKEEVADMIESCSVLLHAPSRFLVISELCELQAFLGERVHAATSSGGDGESAANCGFTASRLDSHHDLLASDPDTLRSMLGAVGDVLHALESYHIQHLFLLLASPRCVNTLISSLDRHLSSAKRIEDKIVEEREKRNRYASEDVELHRKLSLIVQKNSVLAGQIEKSISAIYSGRSVRLSN